MKNCKCKTTKQRGAIAMIVSAIVLVLIPKCPMCIVGWAAVIGVGLSFSMAAMLRYGVIAICVLVIATVIVRALAKRAR